MLHGYVPTGKKKDDWRDYIQCERDFQIAINSGVGWVVFENLPLSWQECREILIKEGRIMRKIVVVSAAWCKQCGVLKDALTKAGVVYHVTDADSEEGMEFCQKNGVRGLPTTFVYEDDELVKTVVGVKSVKEYV